MDNWSVTLNLAEMSDIQGDGVDGTDLGFWSAGFGTVGDALLIDGDFDADSDVDGADVLLWQRQFGSIAAALPTATTVPEPSSLGLLALLGISAGYFRRRLFQYHPQHGNFC